MRRLESDGFPFELTHKIDFNVDFAQWPPAPQIIEQLKTLYPTLQVNPPEDDRPGDLSFSVKEKLSYELVVFIQKAVTEMASPYGGRCESWGVLH